MDRWTEYRLPSPPCCPPYPPPPGSTVRTTPSGVDVELGFVLQVRVVVALLERATEAAVAQLQSVLNATGSSVKLYVMGNSTWIQEGFTTISPKYKHLDGG